MKLPRTVPPRKLLLRLVVASLSITAGLGIAAVLGAGFGQTGRILGSAAMIDGASILVLCCTGPARSAPHRAAQLTGILSACPGLAAGLCATWWDPGISGLREGAARAAVALFVLAAASAHACLILRPPLAGRLAQAVATGTVLCTAAAAELLANYAMVPNFHPGADYLRALSVIVILDAFGTIMILLLPRSALGRQPSANRPDPQLPAVSPGR